MDLNRFDRKIVEKACKKTIYNYDKLPIKDQLISIIEDLLEIIEKYENEEDYE